MSGMEFDTANDRMLELYRLSVQRIARAGSTVLITGESGTGKERMAGLLHYHSQRKDKPFVKVNCAALPEGVLESELFGHERGAFTGAVSRRIGKFEAAHTGTIFLDEVADLTPLVQAKLLRVLQEKELERVGGNATIQVDVRIIAATNKSLSDEVKAGKFREDLFFRLNVISIEIPPLRQRKEDILILTEKFIEKFCKQNGRERLILSPDVKRCLLNYSWPGNVRELENLIERITVMALEDTVTTDDLPSEITSFGIAQNFNGASNRPPTLREAKAEFERGLIMQTLELCNGNVTASSSLLGIARKNLQEKINRYRIEVERYRGQKTDTEA